jgi:hypothetical protein
MKLTKSGLREIIREELNENNSEFDKKIKNFIKTMVKWTGLPEEDVKFQIIRSIKKL